jgi:hypothetical protein
MIAKFPRNWIMNLSIAIGDRRNLRSEPLELTPDEPAHNHRQQSSISEAIRRRSKPKGSRKLKQAFAPD